MAAAPLTADRQTRIKAGGSGRSGIGDVAANAVIFYGATIAKNAAGFTVPASDAAALKVTGISQQFVDNTGGADGAQTVLYTTGVVAELVNNAGAIVQAGKHVKAYAADDNSVTSKALSLHKLVVGTVLKFTATAVFVYIDEALNPDNSAGVVTNGAVSPAVLSSNPVEVVYLDIPDSATATYNYLNADAWEFVGFEAIKDTAGAGNTLQLKDGAGVAISDAIAYAVDKAHTRDVSLDKAKRSIAAGAGFQIAATKAAGSLAGQALLFVIKR